MSATYVINGYGYESPAAVVSAFIAPEADPCTTPDDIYAIVDDIADGFVAAKAPLTEGDLVRLVFALSAYYGVTGAI